MTPTQKALIQQLEDTLRRYHMLTTGDAVIIAVSGGPDSVALLHALTTIRAQWSLHLIVAHLNHGIRTEAAEEADFVEGLAASLGIPCEIGREDVTRFSKKYGLSIQEGARKIRYRFLRDTATTWNARKIALGHHADDNAESVLMHIMRGSGPRGLSGIPPVRENIIRPFIHIHREQIMSYLHEHGLSFKTDRSNTDPKYLRNRVRHELIPILKNRFSVDCVMTLNRLASIMRREESYWEPVVAQTFQSLVITRDESEIVVGASALTALHPALSGRLVRHIVEQLTGTLKRIRYDHVDAVLILATGHKPSGATHLAHEVRVIRNRDELIFRLGTRPIVSDYSYKITTPDTFTVPEIATMFRFSTGTCTEAKRTMHGLPATSALFDREAVSFPLVIRNFRHGDRFIPLGMQGSQKLKKFFIDRKIPLVKRKKCPLLLSQGEIIWVGGYRISDRAKITEKTREVLKVEMVALPPQ